MNLLDITLIVLLALYIISGMYRGSITSLLSTLGFGGAWFGARSLYPRVANMALSNKTLMATLSQYLEPEGFFTTHTMATTSVKDIISGGESAISGVLNSLSPNVSVIKGAFENNLRNPDRLQRLGLNTAAQYLDQTIWEAIFNVAAFLLCFIALYIIASLVVNLLDRVISFPLVKGVDWLIGGVFGFVCGMVMAALVIAVLPTIIRIVSPEFAESLTSGSKLFSLVDKLDLLHVQKLVSEKLIGNPPESVPLVAQTGMLVRSFMGV